MSKKQRCTNVQVNFACNGYVVEHGYEITEDGKESPDLHCISNYQSKQTICTTVEQVLETVTRILTEYSQGECGTITLEE
jgi:hypothetical protein